MNVPQHSNVPGARRGIFAGHPPRPNKETLMIARWITRLDARRDDGMATVEYALVTVAAAAFAAVLIAIIKSPEVRSTLASLVSGALGGG
jgi:hypothetical protein